MGHHVTLPSNESVQLPAGHRLRRFPLIFGVVGVLCLAGSWFAAGGDHKAFYHSYLTAFLFGLSIALGALFFTLFQHAASAGWSVVVRRVAENLMAPLPIFALLFIPLWFGRHDLYHWTDLEHVAHDPVLLGKQGFLNEGFWVVRAAIYFGLWTLMSWWFRSKSIRQDSEGGTALSRLMQMRSYPAIMAFALTISFAAIDWGMSLDPHWYSTMWGVYYFAGSIVSAFAMLGFSVLLMQRWGLLQGIVTKDHFHDIGKLVFAFTVFWAYIAFSQYFLIWYANIPEETSFFHRRAVNTWYVLGIYLMIGHFGLPFFFLMGRTLKKIPWSLALGCVWIITFHYLDLYYVVMPNVHKSGITASLVDGLTAIGVLSIYIALAAWFLGKAALIPQKDPRLPESLAFQNF